MGKRVKFNIEETSGANEIPPLDENLGSANHDGIITPHGDTGIKFIIIHINVYIIIQRVHMHVHNTIAN